MNWYSLTSIAQVTQEVDPNNIQGPAVDALINTVQDMIARGAPTVLDDTGFNKMDYH